MLSAAVRETIMTGEVRFIGFGACDHGGKIKCHMWLLALISLAEKTGGGRKEIKRKLSDQNHLIMN